ncbi:MAG: sel1 repeat family protein [Clostridiales bacterium]|nr:sel1 repeat family protein [Clostridiales bacterium]
MIKGEKVVTFCSATVSWLSAVVVANPKSITFILFCINIGLLLCAVIQTTAIIVLYRKTLCASVVGLAVTMVFGMGGVLFVIQLLMYVYGHPGSMYAISFCVCLLYAAFITSSVYSFMLIRNGHKTLCILAGIFDFIPPIGVVFTVVLSYKVSRDTVVKQFIYKGYAYTYAALGQFCATNKAALIDMAGDEELGELDKKETKHNLKDLKRHVDTAEGQYAYAVALATYAPDKSKTAVKFMKKAAEGNHTAALFNLGYYYEVGAYLPKDLKKARSFYSRAAEAGDEDAALRLGILEVKSGEAAAGFKLFEDRAKNKNDLCAKYNMAICYEKGTGVQVDMDKALDIYCECIEAGSFEAEKRLFAIAAQDINSAQNGEFFRRVTDRQFKGSFAKMIDGLIEIKKRLASDAVEHFLKVLDFNDKWEWFARCIVGTLYIDCGKEMEDKYNGAEYIRSSAVMSPIAKDIYPTLPRAVFKETKARAKAEKNKQSEQKQ